MFTKEGLVGLIPPRLDCGHGVLGGPYWTSRVHTGSGYSGQVRGFVPQDGGSPSQIETHGEVLE